MAPPKDFKVWAAQQELRRGNKENARYWLEEYGTAGKEPSKDNASKISASDRSNRRGKGQGSTSDGAVNGADAPSVAEGSTRNEQSGPSRPKKRRLPSAFSDLESGSEPDEDPGPDVYKTLPEPTSSFIHLRMQLVRFKGVYRVVRVPLTFTFANLSTLVVFLFGWHGTRRHSAHVWSDVEMYSPNWKKWHIKKCGYVPPREAFEDEAVGYYMEMRAEPEAMYKVVPKGQSKKRRMEDNNWGFDPPPATTVTVEDQDLTLGEVWNKKARKNATEGRCTNQEIAIKYDYAGWEVDITCEESPGPFYTVDPPSNLPIVVAAKGSPPIEGVRNEVLGEEEAREKTVPAILFDSQTFAEYCAGRLGSETRKKALVIFDPEEDRAHMREKAKEREARRLKNLKERRERADRGEEDEDADRESDNEYECEDSEWDIEGYGQIW
ncbi:hypothetical protein PLICRDRAFT_641983 [Plicaturopsis crispa FD-325 SS-3]|nr:hypothetical protein PLICRDRAFT_641983 [Plicaturopsis crispa FD-325 SS-3]